MYGTRVWDVFFQILRFGIKMLKSFARPTKKRKANKLTNKCLSGFFLFPILLWFSGRNECISRTRPKMGKILLKGGGGGQNLAELGQFLLANFSLASLLPLPPLLTFWNRACVTLNKQGVPIPLVNRWLTSIYGLLWHWICIKSQMHLYIPSSLLEAKLPYDPVYPSEGCRSVIIS